jgi:hypothetical protein
MIYYKLSQQKKLICKITKLKKLNWKKKLSFYKNNLIKIVLLTFMNNKLKKLINKKSNLKKKIVN